MPATQRTRVYLSGPMTGRPELNFPAFHHAADVLRDAGYLVVNPAESSLQATHDGTWEAYLREDIAAMVKCDVIALLPGWCHSKGAQLEKSIADAVGIPSYPVATFRQHVPVMQSATKRKEIAA